MFSFLLCEITRRVHDPNFMHFRGIFPNKNPKHFGDPPSKFQGFPLQNRLPQGRGGSPGLAQPSQHRGGKIHPQMGYDIRGHSKSLVYYIQLLDAWFMIEFPSISRNKCGGFHTWGYPEIINFYGIFPYKPSILGYPHFRKPSYGASKYWYPTIYLGL